MILFIKEAIRISAAFLFGTTGEIITEKSGHLNLGVPGVMCICASVGVYSEYKYMSSLKNINNAVPFLAITIPILCCLIAGVLIGLLYSFLTVTLRCNQNVTGLTITTFGAGFAGFMVKKINGNLGLQIVAKGADFFRKPLVPNCTGFMQIFLSHGFLVYIAIIVAVAVSLILNKTRVGLNLRAVGESPATADAAGINVTAYKYVATCIGCAIAGFGGFFYTMDCARGSFSTTSVVEMVGWLSVALVIFSLWRPTLAILGSIIFGSLYILPNYLPFALPKGVDKLIGILPYAVTVIVLIVTSIFDSKNAQPPASLGLNYFREDR